MFWKKFVFLCEKIGKTPTAVCADLGFSATMGTKWKNGARPRETTLIKIAEYFNVSTEYLLGTEKEQTTPTEDSNLMVLDSGKMYMIPLFESVSAGFGTLPVDGVVDYMPLYITSKSEAAETICIRVKGDSMYPKIEDGDIIQVHKQEEVNSGSIAVVIIDGAEGLVKKILFYSSGVELQSINPMYPPMRFDGEDASRVLVVGLVTQVIKGVNGREVSSVRMPDNKKALLDTIDRMDAEELREFNKLYNSYLKSKESKD
jgi:repressor LexA